MLRLAQCRLLRRGIATLLDMMCYLTVARCVEVRHAG
jgi:hypothetical protein